MKQILTYTLTFVLANGALADSLWKDGSSRGPVLDKTARAIGDILFVSVSESATVDRDNKSTTSRVGSANAGITSFLFGTQAGATAGSQLGKHQGTYPKMEFTNTSTHEGKGTTKNVDKITAKFGVRVVDVLPNNTMVIEGMRQTSYGGETQVAILRGTVRREDVDSSNMVMSERLADLQIRYVNTGVISDSQNKGWFLKFWDKVSPF